jgi:enoyl-CoA hydratase/carnithine racemase
MSNLVLLQDKGAVTEVILNRPERSNALDKATLDELVAALGSALARGETHTILLHGHGTGFCGGVDLEPLAALPAGADASGAFMPTVEALQQAITMLATAHKVTIAAVHGFVLGAGLDLALACDLRIAAAGTRFACNHVQYGLVPDGGATWSLPRLIGLGPSMALLLSGDALDAEGAYRLGLIHRRVALDKHVTEAMHWAEELSHHPLAAQVAIKRLARIDPRLTLSAALKEEKESQRRLLVTGEVLGRIKDPHTPGPWPRIKTHRE